jgi:uncharacterized LabA/DUF88 family protein
MASSSHGISFHPNASRRMMIFVDATNLVKSLDTQAITLNYSLKNLLNNLYAGNATVQRVYAYTTESNLAVFRVKHPQLFNDCQMVFGDAIEGKNGIREKGVDAQLVADLVYHAAMKNCDIVMVVTKDSDFRFALKRAQDFGAVTGLISFAEEPPDRLKQSVDSEWFEYWSVERLVKSGFATESQQT